MPTYRIRITNSDFSVDDKLECDDVASVERLALKGALEIGVEQALSGEPVFGSEVKIEEGEQVVARYLVTIATTQLKV